MLYSIKRQLNKLGLLVNRFYAFLTGRYDEVIKLLEIRVDNIQAVQTEHSRIWRVLERVDGEQRGDIDFTKYELDKVSKLVQTIKTHLPEAIMIQDATEEYEEVMKTALMMQTQNAQLKLKVEQLENAIKDLSIEFYKHKKGV